MSQPPDLFYTKEHEWVKLEGDVATVGITDYAQHSLGDIVYVELPRVGAELTAAAGVGVVESVKAVSDLFTPVSGDVTEVNATLETDPALVNREPFAGGWLFKVRLAGEIDRSALLDAAAYELLIAEAQ